jgi:hypothetical protein
MQHIFLSQGNLRMLWDVIMENEEIQKNRVAAAKLFNETTPMFASKNESAKKASSITELNKIFLSFMMQNLNHPVDLEIKEKSQLITHEQIQEEKQSIFQRELEYKQKEFENSMKKPTPATPEFSDNIKEEPISEMELMIKKTLEERNFEIQQIHKEQTLMDKDKDWLKSEPTSLKEEKLKSNPVASFLSKLKPEGSSTSNTKSNSDNREIMERLDRLESMLYEIRQSLAARK